MTPCLVTLTFLAVVYSLYFGRDLIMPIAMAGVLNLLLRPLTAWLNEYPRLPMPVAALLVILAALAVITGIAYLISVPSDGLAARAPESLAIVKERLAFLAAPISYLQEALHNIENIGAASARQRTDGGRPRRCAARNPPVRHGVDAAGFVCDASSFFISCWPRATECCGR